MRMGQFSLEEGAGRRLEAGGEQGQQDEVCRGEAGPGYCEHWAQEGAGAAEVQGAAPGYELGQGAELCRGEGRGWIRGTRGPGGGGGSRVSGGST